MARYESSQERELNHDRANYAQIVTVIFLLINGLGKWSLDAVLQSEISRSTIVACRIPFLLLAVSSVPA